jgi:signal transduction histidine kinase
VQSLRRRLIAWYVSVGAFIVLIVGVLAAIAVLEAASFQARQAMAAAVRNVPSAVTQYRAEHKGLRDVDTYLHQRFHSLGVIVHAHPRFGASERSFGGPPFARAKRIVPGGPFAEASVFERLLAMQIKPMDVTIPGGQATVFVDPHSLQGVFTRLGLFILLLALVVLPASWRIAVVVAEHTLQPLVRTTDALNRFGSGEFTFVDVRDDDRSELGELARAYNRAVRQITRALDDREKAEAEMRQFVADAGHQLRTPLTVIMGYLSGMAQRAQTLQEIRRFDSMLSQARRMKELIDRLITLARLEHVGGAHAQTVDLNDALRNVRASFTETAQARIAVLDAPPDAYAAADATDITDALCALVDNALKYAPEGAVEIRLTHEAHAWAVTVADRGPGMTEEDLRSAFDRFYRGSAAETTQGTGLGLSIVRKIVERAGGSMRIENRSGGGLAVTMVLKPAASDVRLTSAASA